MLVLDPFIGPPHPELGELAEPRSTRSVSSAPSSMAACIAWHFYEIQFGDSIPHRPLLDAYARRPVKSFTTPLREPAMIQADTGAGSWRSVPR